MLLDWHLSCAFKKTSKWPFLIDASLLLSYCPEIMPRHSYSLRVSEKKSCLAPACLIGCVAYGLKAISGEMGNVVPFHSIPSPNLHCLSPLNPAQTCRQAHFAVFWAKKNKLRSTNFGRISVLKRLQTFCDCKPKIISGHIWTSIRNALTSPGLVYLVSK